MTETRQQELAKDVFQFASVNGNLLFYKGFKDYRYVEGR
jgi:hypothetical protein